MATGAKLAGISKYEDVISQSEVMRSGIPVLYQMRPTTEFIGTLKRIIIGKKDPKMANKTILFVGETGTGKSTAINTLVNYAMGVKWEDDMWFEIVQEENRLKTVSLTSDVTVYEIYGFEGKTLPYSLTIIDTPGFGDTTEQKPDAAVEQRLYDLFRSKNSIQELDIVGLMLKATENRLTPRLKNILESVLSLFGKDIEKNIVAFMTHSDGMPPNNAIAALLDANIKCAKNEKNQPVHFLFNNRQREERNEETETLENAWRQMTKGLQRFTQFMDKTQPIKLALTVEVLNSRIQLTAAIHNLQEQIKSAEMKQLEIEKTEERLKQHKDDLENDENFTIEVDEAYKTLEKYDGGWSFPLSVVMFDGVTRCTSCEENCHYPHCTIAWSASSCEVMEDEHCTVCTRKCSVEQHIKDQQKYGTKLRKVKKTLQQLKDKFENQGVDTSSLLKALQREKKQVEAELNQWLEEAYQNVLKLEAIALTFKTQSTQAYLDVLIEKMRARGDTVKLQKLLEIASQVDDDTKAVMNDVFGTLQEPMECI